MYQALSVHIDFQRCIILEKEAARFGIGADRSVNYKCDEAGTALNYEVISEAVCSVRAARPLSADWKRRIDEDVQRRGR